MSTSRGGFGSKTIYSSAGSPDNYFDGPNVKRRASAHARLPYALFFVAFGDIFLPLAPTNCIPHLYTVSFQCKLIWLKGRLAFNLFAELSAKISGIHTLALSLLIDRA